MLMSLLKLHRQSDNKRVEIKKAYHILFEYTYMTHMLHVATLKRLYRPRFV
ncbi:hypothetical protein JHK86_041692 [Glycine max]|nr:hypothetical protein JHK86_041692 [Glycine max]